MFHFEAGLGILVVMLCDYPQMGYILHSNAPDVMYVEISILLSRNQQMWLNATFIALFQNKN